jgi:hypothetical protein
MSFVELPELPECDSEVLAAAVRLVVEKQATDVAAPSVGPRALIARLPRIERMEQGAENLFSSVPPANQADAEAARYFGAIVETCYLVAIADGFAAEERGAVAALLGFATGDMVSHERAEGVFDAYAKLLEEQGLEARLDSIAERLDDFMAREEAMSFAALVAVADRELAAKEAVMLMALAKRFDFSRGEVQAVVKQVAATLAQAIREKAAP